MEVLGDFSNEESDIIRFTCTLLKKYLRKSFTKDRFSPKPEDSQLHLFPVDHIYTV
jgi:hypothetical protein